MLAPVLLLSGVASRSEPMPYPLAGATSQTLQTQASLRSLESSLRLVRDLASGEPGKNELVSPFSLREAMLLLAEGMPASKRKPFANLTLRESIRKDLREGTVSRLANANAVWTIGTQPLEGYTARLRALDGEIHTAGSPAKALPEINAFVKEKTKSRIPKIFDSLNSGTELVLVNAIAFDGVWKYPFAESATKAEPFRGKDGVRNVPMMHLRGSYLESAESAGYRAVSLPYEEDRFDALLVLPPAGRSAAASLKSLNASTLRALMQGRGGPTNIALPKVDLSASYDIRTLLSKQGFGGALDLREIRPSFSAQRVDQGVHKTMLRWDERKTEAAAATGIATTRAAPMQPKEFIFDRPFLVFIRHKASGTILFAGAIEKP